MNCIYGCLQKWIKRSSQITHIQMRHFLDFANNVMFQTFQNPAKTSCEGIFGIPQNTQLYYFQNQLNHQGQELPQRICGSFCEKQMQKTFLLAPRRFLPLTKPDAHRRTSKIHPNPLCKMPLQKKNSKVMMMSCLENSQINAQALANDNVCIQKRRRGAQVMNSN